MIDILTQVPGYIGWKDIHFRHLGCNGNLASVFNFGHPSKIINLTDAELPGCTESLYTYHKKNDELTLMGKTIKAIHQSASPFDGSLFYFVKKPLVDASNAVKGLIYHCQELVDNDFIKNIYNTDKKYKPHSSNYYVVKSDNPYNLSIRELECLFCILRGLSAKAVAEQLKLSKRTIESYIDNIKNKFGCRTKHELLIAAMSEGYMDIIPDSFLKDGKRLFY